MKYFKILALGDAVGKLGRQAAAAALPGLKKKFEPDLTILQAENLAHGYGITAKTLKQMQNAGVDFFTGGNHIFNNTQDLEKTLADFPIIRPANYIENLPGSGYKIITVKKLKVLIINLLGQVFIKEKLNNPFTVLDNILKKNTADITIVDFHAEATSEKKSLGYYADGRVNLFFGTHTHVQTADNLILPKNTAYITDIGMIGLLHSSLGMDLKNIIYNFKHETELPQVIPEHGACIVNGIFAKIEVGTGRAAAIKRISVLINGE